MAQGTVGVVEVRARPGLGWMRFAVTVAAVAAVCHVLIGAAYADLGAILVAVSFVVAPGLIAVLSVSGFVATVGTLTAGRRGDTGEGAALSFEAAPGTYEFVCAIPGHDVAGMVGTLTVTSS